MLISISEVFETSVSVLLGETVVEPKADDLKAISEKLEVINLQMAHKEAMRRKVIHWFFISFCVSIAAVVVALIVLNSPYLNWDYNEPETAVAGVLLHAFEWLFVRVAPFALIAAISGICLTRKKR